MGIIYKINEDKFDKEFVEFMNSNLTKKEKKELDKIIKKVIEDGKTKNI